MHFFRDSKLYFHDQAAVIAKRNLQLLKVMTLCYLGCLIFLYLFLGLPSNNEFLKTVVIIAFALQAVYSVLVFLCAGRLTTLFATDCFIIVFGVLIDVFSLIIDIFAFSDIPAIIVPLMVVLIVQIYTLPPVPIILQCLIFSGSFILMSFIFLPKLYFYYNLFSTLAALIIAGISYVTAMYYKISAARYSEELEHMCSLDPMTGMLNKISFQHHFVSFQHSKKDRSSYAMIIMDIDKFKSVNDQYGHAAGDNVLKMVTSVLYEYFPNTEDAEFGRFGGDEFMVLLKHSGNSAKVNRTFIDFRETVRKRSKELFSFPVTCSMGAALSNQREVSFRDLFLIADRMLYCVKAKGGDAIVINDDGVLTDRKPFMLLANFPEEDYRLVLKTFKTSYWVLSAFELPETISIINRYDNNISVIIVNMEGDYEPFNTMLPQAIEDSSLQSTGVVIVKAEDVPLSAAWKKLDAVTIMRPLEEQKLKETVSFAETRRARR